MRRSSRKNMALNNCGDCRWRRNRPARRRCRPLPVASRRIPITTRCCWKPTADCTAQVIIHGHPIGNLDAVDYHAYKAQAQQAVFESAAPVRAYDHVVVEGANSPAEVSLRHATSPTWVSPRQMITRCGWWRISTMAACSRISSGAGLHFGGIGTGAHSRFHQPLLGDLGLLRRGWTGWGENRQTGAGGAVPAPGWISPRRCLAARAAGSGTSRIVVPALPHTNHTDFDPAAPAAGAVDFRYIGWPGTADHPGHPGRERPRRSGVAARRRLGCGDPAASACSGKPIGICGGYQMLGERIDDRTDSKASGNHQPRLPLEPDLRRTSSWPMSAACYR